jgi:hypothetical protein
MRTLTSNKSIVLIHQVGQSGVIVQVDAWLESIAAAGMELYGFDSLLFAPLSEGHAQRIFDDLGKGTTRVDGQLFGLGE